MPDDASKLARVADDIEQWQLSSAAWQHVAVLLDSAVQALEQDDAAALRAALAGLELMSPLLITWLGAEPVLPPEREVRERVTRLRAAIAAREGRDRG